MILLFPTFVFPNIATRNSLTIVLLFAIDTFNVATTPLSKNDI